MLSHLYSGREGEGVRKVKWLKVEKYCQKKMNNIVGKREEIGIGSVEY